MLSLFIEPHDPKKFEIVKRTNHLLKKNKAVVDGVKNGNKNNRNSLNLTPQEEIVKSESSVESENGNRRMRNLILDLW